MNEETTKKEETSSENIKNELVKLADLKDLSLKSELHSVIQTEDFKHYILLDDVAGNKFWHEFDGISIDDTVKANEWFKKGQNLFTEHMRTADELAQMRQLLLSVSNLAHFLQWNEDVVGKLLDEIIVVTSFKFYRTDKNYTGSLEELEHDDDFMSYINMTALLVKSFVDTVQTVRDSTEQACEDIKNVPDKGDDKEVLN